MPATATHTYFARDVFDILDKDITAKINIKSFEMFSQGTDPLMFYNIMSLKPGKKIRNLQRINHREKSRDFFINLVNDIKDRKLYNNENVCSYLAGMISHYALDSTVHPFVIYKTGYFNKKDKSSFKYNGIHSLMESFIDMDMISKREKVKPYKFDVSKMCFNNIILSNDLINVINNVFFNTYGIKDVGNAYKKSLFDMKKFIHLFRYDKYGIKKCFYKCIDTFTLKKSFRFESLSYNVNIDNDYGFLNNNHKEWFNPMDNNISSNSSFIDLYLRAMKLARILIESVFLYFDGNDIDLDSLFLNKSYLTGLDCDLGFECKYFEF